MPDFLAGFDRGLFLLINLHHNSFFDIFFISLTQLGNGWVAAPAVALTVFMITPRKMLRNVLIAALASMAISGIINTQIKHKIDRLRPSGYYTHANQGTTPAAIDVHTVGPALKYHSFPSGHTNTAFAAVTVLVMLYGGYFRLLYAPALLVGYSRVYTGAHFPLDVLAGAALAVMVVCIAMSIFKSTGFITPGERTAQ